MDGYGRRDHDGRRYGGPPPFDRGHDDYDGGWGRGGGGGGGWGPGGWNDGWGDRRPPPMDAPPKRRRMRDDPDDYGRYGGPPRRFNGPPQVRLFEPPLKPIGVFLDAIGEMLPPEVAQERYREYQEEFFERQCEEFFDSVHKHEWLRELYHPAEVAEREKLMSERAQREAVTFFEDSKEFDFGFRREGEDGRDGAGTSNEGEEAGHGDAAEKNSDAGAEGSEGAGEGSDEKNSERADGGGDEGGGEEGGQETTMQADEDAAGKEPQSEEGGNGGDAAHDAAAHGQSAAIPVQKSSTLFVKTILPLWKRSEIEEVLSSVPGCRLKHLQLSAARRTNGFVRNAWAVYEAPEQAAKVLEEKGSHRMAGGQQLGLIHSDVHPTLPQYDGIPVTKVCYAMPCAASDARVRADMKNALALAKSLDRLRGVEDNPWFAEGASMLEDLPHAKALDQLLGYLRVVHLYCYYCARGFENLRDMYVNCAMDHLRGAPDAGGLLPNPDIEMRWVNAIERAATRLKNTTSFPTVDALKEDAREAFKRTNTEEREANRFQCRVCSKLFRGPEFVGKHIGNKHGEELEVAGQQAVRRKYLDNFLANPSAAGVTLEWWMPPPPPMYGGRGGPRGMRGGRGRGMRGGMPFAMGPPGMPPMMPPGRGGARGGGGGRRGGRRGEGGGGRAPVYRDLDEPAEKQKPLDYRTLLVYDE